VHFRIPFFLAVLLLAVSCGPEAPPRAGDAPTAAVPLVPTRTQSADGPTTAPTLTPPPTVPRATEPPDAVALPTEVAETGADRLPELVLARSLGSPDAPITVIEFSDYQ
jgi:hypothetical protein